MKHFLSILILSLILATNGLGATYYVSQTATNGYQIGVDTNNGTAKGTPFLTIGKARATYAAGDTIYINDGTYLTTDGGSGATSLTLSKTVTILPETSLGATIQGTNATYTVYLNPSENAVFTLGAIIIDGRNTAQRCVSLNTTAFTSSIYLTGTRLLNPTTYGWHSSEPDHDFHATNISIYANNMLATGHGINIVSNTSGTIDIDGLDLDIDADASGTVYGVEIKSTDGGTNTTARVAGVHGSITNSNASGTVVGVLIRNVPAAVIEDGTAFTVTAGGPLSSYGYKISTSGAFQSDGCIIRNNTGLTFNAAAGYAIIIGESSGVVAEDNKCNNGKIYGNSATGIENGQTGTPHGIVMGPNTGGEVYGNTATNFSPCYLLAKTDSTTVAHHNLAINPYGQQGLYAKGAVGSKFYNNTVVMADGYNAQALACQIHFDTGNPACNGVEFKNNIVINNNATDPRFVRVANDGSTATFDYNLYYSPSALASNAFAYQANSYATFALWQGAGYDTHGVNADPKIKSTSDYHLQSSSPALYTGIPSVWAGTANVTDMEGNAITNASGAISTVCGGLLSIGAYQSQYCGGIVDIGAYEFKPAPKNRGFNTGPKLGTSPRL